MRIYFAYCTNDLPADDVGYGTPGELDHLIPNYFSITIVNILGI